MLAYDRRSMSNPALALAHSPSPLSHLSSPKPGLHRDTPMDLSHAPRMLQMQGTNTCCHQLCHPVTQLTTLTRGVE